MYSISQIMGCVKTASWIIRIIVSNDESDSTHTAPHLHSCSSPLNTAWGRSYAYMLCPNTHAFRIIYFFRYESYIYKRYRISRRGHTTNTNTQYSCHINTMGIHHQATAQAQQGYRFMSHLLWIIWKKTNLLY